MAKRDRKTTRRTFIGYGVGAAVLAGAVATARILKRRPRQRRSDAGQSRAGLGERFQYDIGKLTRIDPALLTYRSVDTIDTGLTDANDMQIGPGGAIHVASGQTVATLDADGSTAKALTLGGTAQGIAWDDERRMYVGVKDHVEVYDARGVRLAAWAAIPGQPYVTSIAIAGNDVFVADAGNRQVLRYDTAGEILARIGPKDQSGEVRFVIPSPYFDVRIGPDGLLWIANTGRHRIEGCTFDGELVRSWGKASMAIDGFCGCCNPCHFAIMPDGRFVTSEKGLARVKVHGPDGALQGVVASPEMAGATVTGSGCAAADTSVTLPAVAPDDTGRVFVLHAKTGRLTILEPIETL